MKKIVIVAASVAALGLVIGGYAYYKTPMSYVSIDINPSVELGVNAFDRVIDVKAANVDGQTVLEGQNLENKSVSDAVNEYITSAAENNFIKSDGSTVISVTGVSDNDKSAEQLTDETEKAAASAVHANRLSAVYYKDTSDLNLREQAQQFGLTPGKYKLIKALQSLDSSASIEQLKDAPVSDIMKQLKTYVAQSGDENAALTSDEMQKIADLVKDKYNKSSESKANDKKPEQNDNKNNNGKGNDKGGNTFNKDNICFEYNELGAGVGDTFNVKIMSKTEDGKLIEFTGKCDYSYDKAYISFENGQFKALKEGKTVIKATYNGNEAGLNVTIGNQSGKDKDTDKNKNKNMLFFNMNDFSVGVNGSSGFQVMTVENEKKLDVTSQCKFDYDTSVIGVNSAQKLISGKKVGTSVLKASYKGMTATAKVNVIQKNEPTKDISAEISRAENVTSLARDYGVDVKGLQIDAAEQKVREAIAAWQGVSIAGLSPAQADALLAKTKNNQMTAEGVLFQNAAGLLGLNSNAITPVMKAQVAGKLGINFNGMTLEQEAAAINDALSRLGLTLP